MEILAPAGSREAFDCAVAAGADAVYLGFSAFNARAGAGNFDGTELTEVLRRAHLRHMRVYVTVNTLIKDRELPEVEELLRLLNRLRVDGILVQDAGVLRLTRSRFPGLAVHASTQMAIHHATGVRWCAAQGMKRGVLARECSLGEIRKCAGAGVDIEVFGHGAQCVSVSGECLFSSMAGERSGNRGRCAQPCRQRYRFDGKPGAWLSPRDLCLRDRLPELAEAGVFSLKTEGRLKRPEYVYTVIGSYRRAEDDRVKGDFHPADTAERESLMQVFHRGGFMEGYAFGAEDAGVIQPFSVNHQGLPVGQVKECRGNLARIQLIRSLGDGDTLRIHHAGRTFEMTYAGKDTPAGGTALLRLREGVRAEAGDEVDRLVEARQVAEAAAGVPKGIPVDLKLEAKPGEPLRMTASDGVSEVTVTGATVSAARTRETGAAEMERQLRKTGGTEFAARQVQVAAEGVFVPVSMLNELRRQALSLLEEKRIDAFAPPEGPEIRAEEYGAGPARKKPDRPGEGGAGQPDEPGETAGKVGALEAPLRAASAGTVRSAAAGYGRPLPERIVIARSEAQADAVRGKDVMLIHAPEDYRTEALEGRMAAMEPGEWLCLPTVCEEDTLRELLRLSEKYAERLGGILLGSIGQLGLKWPVPVAAGPGIPVMNREAIRFLEEQGCVFVTASPELTGEEGRRLAGSGEEGLPVVFPAYGRTQLMLLHHCPARTVQGWSQGHSACWLCEEGDPRALRGKTLEDERGHRFPLQRVRLPEGCLVRLLNTVPTDLGDKPLPGPGLMELTVETGEEARELWERFRRHERAPGESTRGHWSRPVL